MRYTERRKNRDHPRGCGENYLVMSLVDITTGSPPRMRGKRFFHVERRRKNRITPADAGKTCRPLYFDCFPQDHPRGCGENPEIDSRFMEMIGSPPRMRGKRPCGGIASIIFGITPADAGKTFCGIGIYSADRDHPRGCGENPWFAFTPSTIIGSPPRMRGKQFSAVFCAFRERITPADAGKTIAIPTSSFVFMDHPRGCGENFAL